MRKNMYVPQDIPDLLDFVMAMMTMAPKFLDKTGYFPYRNLDYVFQQLYASLDLNRAALGDDRYNQLLQISEQMRTLFEADPDDKTGDTAKGCELIHDMIRIIREVRPVT